MRAQLRAALDVELKTAHANEARGDKFRAFAHLKRAHILAQRFTLAHAGVHLRMLAFGWRQRDVREMIGQTLRLLAALLFSRIWVPEGNTGGANVSALKPMPVPPDLHELLRAQPGESR